jgi:2-oxo-4-hydroxy-4-carboxy--5-ureidoimidazoline (OHCU) decarboxylase
VIALHAQPDLSAVFAQFEDRLRGEPDTERARALEQVISVMTARLNRLIAGTPAETGDVT